MYRADEFSEFAIEEFRRGLEELTDEEPHSRPETADGTRMNAISWSVQHIADHWLNVARSARGLPLENERPPSDGTPPRYSDALAMLNRASDLGWLAEATDEAMSRQWIRPSDGESDGETVAMFLARAVLHSWFHIGEVNAMRQLLGHAEIIFVGDLAGRLDWVSKD